MIKIECEVSDLQALLSKQSETIIQPFDLRQLISACRSGAKIGAIKYVRTLTNMPLREAKDLVEAGWDHPYNETA
jgi:ribosomal protein L7/L12